MSTLYELRTKKGFSQQAIADALNMSRVNYTNIENGKRNLTKENAIRLAELLDVSVDTLFGREQSGSAAVLESDEAPVKRQIVVKPSAAAVKIPLVGSFRCGYSRNGEEFLRYDELEVLPSFFERYGPDLVAYIAVGNSMTPTIRPGDLMYGVQGDAWEDNDIVALVIDDAETIKRIRHAPDGGIDIIPDNEVFRSIHLSPKDLQTQQVAVLARIVKIERDL